MSETEGVTLDDIEQAHDGVNAMVISELEMLLPLEKYMNIKVIVGLHFPVKPELDACNEAYLSVSDWVTDKTNAEADRYTGGDEGDEDESED